MSFLSGLVTGIVVTLIVLLAALLWPDMVAYSPNLED